MKTFKPHPAAELFPMMSDAEIADLATDIAVNGQLEPIIVNSKNLLLDGRNRLAACRLAKIEPDIMMWDREDDPISPIDWIIAKNLKRRHLNPSQAGLIAAGAIKLYSAEARARQNKGKKDLSAPGRQGKATAAAAKAFGSAARTVERASALIAKAPKKEIEKIRAGEKTLKEVERDLKRSHQLEEVRAYVPPAGEFGIVVVDYPWKFDDARDGSERARSGAEYPRMTLEEVCAFRLPVAQDCLIGVWVPNALLIDGTWERVRLSLEARYGAVPKQMRTWNKTEADGGDFTGLGKAFRNDTEHLVLLEMGAVTYVETGAEHEVPILRTGFSAPIGRGSEKPALAYEQLAAICPMRPCIDLFSRKTLPGWVTSGAEMPKKKRRLKIEDVEAA